MAVHARLLALLGSWECDEYSYLVFPQSEHQGSVLRTWRNGARTGQHRWFPNVVRVSPDNDAVYWGATCRLATISVTRVLWTSLRSGSLWTWSRAVAPLSCQPPLRRLLWSWDGSLDHDLPLSPLDAEMEQCAAVPWMMRKPPGLCEEITASGARCQQVAEEAQVERPRTKPL